MIRLGCSGRVHRGPEMLPIAGGESKVNPVRREATACIMLQYRVSIS